MKTFICAFIFCAILTSCGDNTLSAPTTTSIPPTGYFPLEVGYTWNYQVYGGIGGTEPDNIYLLTVDSKKEVKGLTYYNVITKRGPQMIVVASDYYREENEKVYKYINDKDSLFIDFNNQDTTKGYYTEIIDSMKTSMGTLRNVRSLKWNEGTYQNITYFFNQYYAPNIGFIGDEYVPMHPDAQNAGLTYAKLGEKVYK